MSTLDRIKESVSGGIKAVEDKIAQKEAEIAEIAEQKKKEKLAREKARARKRRWLKVKRVAAVVLMVLAVVADVLWYILERRGKIDMQFPIQPIWAALLMAFGAAAMLTGKLIPIKVGVILFGGLMLGRENGWLGGVLSLFTWWQLGIAALAVVAIIYIVLAVVRIKNGTLAGFRKAKKAIEKKTDEIRAKVNGKK